MRKSCSNNTISYIYSPAPAHKLRVDVNTMLLYFIKAVLTLDLAKFVINTAFNIRQ